MIISITSNSGNLIRLGGSIIDVNTRCIHYHTNLDIIAIKFKCCDIYYPCYKCHEEISTCFKPERQSDGALSTHKKFEENFPSFDVSKIYNYVSSSANQFNNLSYNVGDVKEEINVQILEPPKQHSLQRWSRKELNNEMVILCGLCYHELKFDQYSCNSAKCPLCQGNFNPKCSLHYSLYFNLNS